MITYLQLLDTQQEKTVFAVLYEKYHRQLYNRAMHLVKDSAAAEDLVHETFLTVTKNMDKIIGADYMKNWGYLLTILQHLTFNEMKKQKKISSHDMETDYGWTASEKNIEDEYISRETAVLLAKLIRQLDYPYRQVICLQYYNGMKTREIAEVMKLSRENVKKISKRAREKLKKQLIERGYGG